MTDEDTLVRTLDEWKDTSFRLESLDEYTVDHEAVLLRAFLRGDPVPPAGSALETWPAHLRRERAEGKMRSRVHAIVGPLTPYLHYEIQWAYTACASAGEDIRLVHRWTWEDTPFGERPPDFYLLDDTTVAVMAYDEVGHWLGGDIVTDPVDVARYRILRDRALSAAVPLSDYLAALRRVPIDPPALVPTESRAHP